MTIAIRPGVLMPKSNNVTQFVYDYTELVAIFPDADSLRSVTSFSDKRTTAAKKNFFDIYITILLNAVE